MQSELVPVPPHLTAAVANLRHALRTPLNQIIGLSELLTDQSEADGQDELHEDLTHIRDAAWKLNAMLEELIIPEGFQIPVPYTDTKK